MIKIAEESFKKIVPLMQEGRNYVNIYGMLKDKYKLSEPELETFAEVLMESNSAKWLAPDGTDYRPFSEATIPQRHAISTLLNERYEMVTAKLAQRKDLLQSIFIVPREDCMMWWEDAEGQMHVKLAEWGFKEVGKSHDVDIIGLLFETYPPAKQVDVILHVLYSDDRPANQQELSMTMLNNTRTVKTNDEGDIHCGKLFPGQLITVADEHGQSATVEVIPDVNEYTIRLDVHTGYSVTVIDDQGQPKAGYHLTIDGREHVTDEQGCVIVDDILFMPGTAITVQGEYGAPAATYNLQRDPQANQFEYNITAPRTGFVVTVQNQDGQIKPNFDLTINGQKFTTNGTGQVMVNEMVYQDDTVIVVKGYRDNDQEVSFTVGAVAQDNNFLYTVFDATPPPVKRKPITLTFIDLNNQPLAGVPIQVTTKAGKRLMATTDEQGRVFFSRDEFQPGEKPKIEFLLSKEYQQTHKQGKFK